MSVTSTISQSLPASAADFGLTSNTTVALSAPQLNPPIYNALAIWNPVRQEACLISSKALKVQDSPDKPWASETECQLWRPDSAPEQGVYDVKWDNGKSIAPLIISANPTARPKNKVAVIVPDYTWQAYNLQSGGNFYFWKGTKKKGEEFSSGKLSLLRPNNFVLVGDPVGWPTVTQEFPGVNPIAFLRKNNANVDVIQQSKLDEYKYDLSNYQTLVLYGHDEYWTKAVRDGIQTAVEQGTNLLNLSGNTGYRHIIRDGETIRFETPTPNHPNTSLWGEATGTTSPAQLLGVHYLGQPFNMNLAHPIKLKRSQYLRLLAFGFPRETPRAQATKLLQGLRVTAGVDTLFAGTGLKIGDWFGFETKAMSYELDGVAENAHGSPSRLAFEAFGSTIPKSYAETWLHPYGESKQFSRAGMLTLSQFGRGKVFSAGSVGWMAAIIGGDEKVARVTLNALNLLEK